MSRWPGRVLVLGFRVQGLGLRLLGLSRILGLGFKSLGFRDSIDDSQK